MKTPEIELNRLTIRPWLYRAAWGLFGVVVVLFLAAAWAPAATDERLVLTAMLLSVLNAGLMVGGVQIGMGEVEDRFAYGQRVEARAPLCTVIGSVAVLIVFTLLLASFWVGSHAGDLAQTAVALLPVAFVSAAMATDWEEF